MTLNQQWNSEYSDTNSPAFIEKASKIENALLSFYKNTSFGSSVLGVQVTEIRNGSLIVDYVIIFDKSQTIPISQIQTAAVQAISDPSLASLSPDTSKKPSALGKYCTFFDVFVKP